MEKKMLIGGVAVLLLILVGASVFLLWSNPTKTGTQNSGANNKTTAQTNSSAILFSSSQYAPFSYPIFPNASANVAAHAATSDFVMSTTPAGANATTVSLNFTDSRVVYTVVVSSNQKLYFIDTNLGDDGPGGDHAYTGDDGYVLVNQTGYIVTVAYPLPHS